MKFRRSSREWARSARAGPATKPTVVAGRNASTPAVRPRPAGRGQELPFERGIQFARERTFG